MPLRKKMQSQDRHVLAFSSSSSLCENVRVFTTFRLLLSFLYQTEKKKGVVQGVVHIRNQQRNGRKVGYFCWCLFSLATNSRASCSFTCVLFAFVVAQSLTTIAGLAEDIDVKKIVKVAYAACAIDFPCHRVTGCVPQVMRKMFSTNGTILKDDEVGEVIQLQGDRRKDASDFLIRFKICEKDEIKVHGF